MVRWFGEDWHSGFTASCPHEKTPVGKPCVGCGGLIEEGDRGVLIPQAGERINKVEYVPYHLEPCWMETIVGPNWRDLVPEGDTGGGAVG